MFAEFTIRLTLSEAKLKIKFCFNDHLNKKIYFDAEKTRKKI